jgi:transposase
MTDYGRLRGRPMMDRTLQATVEALMYSLRERGVHALEEPATKRRLAELSDEQVIEVGERLQRLKPEIARAWTADEVKHLMRSR